MLRTDEYIFVSDGLHNETEMTVKFERTTAILRSLTLQQLDQLLDLTEVQAYDYETVYQKIRPTSMMSILTSPEQMLYLVLRIGPLLIHRREKAGWR